MHVFAALLAAGLVMLASPVAARFLTLDRMLSARIVKDAGVQPQ